MPKILTKILNRFNGALIFEAEVNGETESIRLGLAVKLAISAKANLYAANLGSANLESADLRWANLESADLESADLRSANLGSANLGSANLRSADLRSADLYEGCKLVGERAVFQIGPIGSRCAYLTVFLTDKGIHLRTGCFFGPIEEFRKALESTHDGNVHGKEYAAALDLILKHAELWMPGEEPK